MDQHAMGLLQVFAKACPRTLLRHDDWQRLYEFTLHVHRQRVVPTTRTVRDYLITQGCSLQKASWLSNQFGHFCALLRLYDGQKNKRDNS